MVFQVTEPHPSVNATKRSAYLATGRGGAGNISRYNTSTLTVGPSAAGPASRSKLTPPPTSAKMMTGRGGAGNIHRSSAKPTAPLAAAPSLKPRTSSESSNSSSSSDAVPASPSSQREHAIFSFDEELERDQRMRDNAARTPVYHIGRGGAGNAFQYSLQQQRTNAGAPSVAAASFDSSDSAKRRSIANMMEKISRTLSRS